MQQDAAEFLISLLNEVFETLPDFSHLFMGSVTCKHTCTLCGEKTYVEDPFLLFNMNMSDVHDEIGLKDLIGMNHALTNVEAYCSRCQRNVAKNVNKVFSKLPPLLMVVCNRFADLANKHMAKLKFPQTLSFEDYKADSYALTAIVRHMGRTLYEGHYIADVLEEEVTGNDTWRRYDDGDASEIAVVSVNI